MEILSHEVFRVARDADFDVSDEAADLVRAVEAELRRRRFGEVVRLEVGANMEPSLREQLVRWLDLEERQVYDIEGMLDMTDLWQIHGIDGFAELRETQVDPAGPAAVPPGSGGGRHLRRDEAERHARPPPVRLVRALGRAVRASRP